MDTIFDLVRSSNAINAGDFNGHHSAWGSSQCNYRGNLIYSCLSTFNLYLLNNGSHTRINRPPHVLSALDISLVSSKLLWSSDWSTMDNAFGSDHILVRFFFPIHTITNYEGLSKLTFNSISWPLFQNSDSELIKNFPIHQNGIARYISFVDLLVSAASLCSSHRLGKRRTFSFSPIWWSKVCSVAIKDRKNAYTKYRHSGSRQDFFNYQKTCNKNLIYSKITKEEILAEFVCLFKSFYCHHRVLENC